MSRYGLVRETIDCTNIIIDYETKIKYNLAKEGKTKDIVNILNDQQKEISTQQEELLKQSEIMVKQREEIDKLTAESTEWESKFYDEAKKVDKAIEYIENELSHMTSNGKLCRKHLLNILRGDKE